MEKTSEQFDFIINQCRKVFKKKLQEYGSSWRILRVSSVTDQIFIKGNRIRNIEEKGVQKVNEDISEDFSAIINYAAIGLIQLEKKSSLEADMPYEEALEYYDRQIARAKALIEQKNHDYGEAWREMRLSSITDMILQKILRMKQVEKNRQKKLVSETSEGHYIDLLNYAVFALIKIYERYNNPPIIPPPPLLMKLFTIFSRTIVGFLFILSGCLKLIDPISFSYKFEEYFSPSVLNLPFLINLSFPLVLFLALFECFLGFMLWLGIAKNSTSSTCSH
ncbi:MAG: DUF1599 domain-containing protein [Flavobacteriales bacterium Tduv]